MEHYFDVQLQQLAYREILNAFSYPGNVRMMENVHHPAWLAMATLIDEHNSISDRSELMPPRLSFALGCRKVQPEAADFVLCDVSRSEPEFTPRLGDLYRPDLGATLVWLCSSIGSGPLKLRLTGPGIESSVEVSLAGLRSSWIVARNAWVSHFPIGVDVLVCDTERILGLPRSSRVEIIGEG